MDFDKQRYLDRYSRQIVLPEVGASGQERISKSRVLVVGAGGLGAPLLSYLVMAGVGTIILLDPDRVERSNLQRQTLFEEEDIGELKVEVAQKYLEKRNSEVNVHAVAKRFQHFSPGEKDLPEPHILVDGSDNFDTKFSVSDASIQYRIPAVIGGILRHRGQVMSIHPGHSACYRCIFESPPPDDKAPDCSEAGVLGPLAGTVGSLQGYEVLKIILGFGTPLFGKILTIQPDTMEFRTRSFKRNADCTACGEGAN